MPGLILNTKGVPLFGVKGEKINFNNLLLGQQSPSSKIILATDYQKLISRKELIEKFLNQGWLTEKQMKGMKPWLFDMLNEFSLEVLLHAKHGSIENLLGDVTNVKVRHRKESIPLTIVTQKPKKNKITVDEIGGDLSSDVKLIKLQDVSLVPPTTYDDCC